MAAQALCRDIIGRVENAPTLVKQPKGLEAVGSAVLCDGCHNAVAVTTNTPEFEALRSSALICTACGLSETRKNVVFGVGPTDARVFFVGEAPGKNEDLQGEPFVGAAGRLLDELLGEIGIQRSEVYIANVLKCRPPGNRDPKPNEIDSCKGYLRTQIRLISPEVVVTLGNFATKLLLRTDTGITRMRGQSYEWWLGAKLIPTFHPAAALRGGDRVKNQMREDFALAKSVLAVEVSEREIQDDDQIELFG